MVKPTQGSVVTVFPPTPTGPGASGQDPNAGIVRGDGADWFGPLDPMHPTAPPEVAGRRFDYPSGYNLYVWPRSIEGAPFPTLRGLADSYDLLRIVLETRKDQMARMLWKIVPREKPRAKAGTGELDGAPDPRIAALEAFFRRPDKEHTWAEWLRMLLEDMFVIDAATLYKRRTRGGALYSLEPVAGDTIKPVLDDWGRRPLPPSPAYQQVLKGLPAVNYLSTDMVYRPRNPRTNRVYGYSNVEQIIMTVNIALRRQIFTLQYFTEGNVPEALIGVPDSWTPDQIRAFQDYWDSVLEGNTAQRRHAKFVPAGVGKTYVATKEAELKGVFDEWLARIVCFTFSIPPTPFVAQVNRATADNAKEQSLEDGLVPTQQWVKDIIDAILEDDFASPDLEFQWQEDEETDPKTAADIADMETKSGRLTIDEWRASQGLTPFGGNAAKPQVWTAAGYVPLDAYEQGQARAAEAAKAMADATANAPAADEAKPGETEPGKPKPKAGEVGKAAAVPFHKAHARGKVGKAPGALPYPRKVTRTATASVAEQFRDTFTAQKTAAVAAAGNFITDALIQAATKQPDMTAIESALSAMGLPGADAGGLAGHYETVATDSGELAYAQVAAGDADIFEQVNEPAAAWARERSAALVAGVDDTTRNQLRTAIADGLAAGETNDEIAARIEALGAFSADRAQLIADTEIAAANSQGALNGYRAARDNGVVVKKEWILGEHPCDECQDNAAAGAIGLDEAFPSGDDAPPGHPNCECALSPVVEIAEDADADA